MFTGIIEEVGNVIKVENLKNIKKVVIKSNVVIVDAKIGDSIAVNGVCLTVTNINFSRNFFQVDIVDETLNKTALCNIQKNDSVNLERSLKLSDRLSGHIVQGHIEGTAIIKNKIIDNNNVILRIELDINLMKFCILKGSITIDGVSLTIASIEHNVISIALIPHTIANTNLGLKEENDLVNIETDIIGKYIDRLIHFDDRELESENLIVKINNLNIGES